MHILEELWNGNIQPADRTIYRAEEYRELVRLYERNENRLLATLNDGQKEDLQKTKDLTEEMQGICECGAFIVGFQLAGQLLGSSFFNFGEKA